MRNPITPEQCRNAAVALADRLGWTVGQKVIARPGRPYERFSTWRAVWFKLSRIVEDIDAARARRAANP